MLQNGVVQHGYAGLLERALIDFTVQLIVAEVVEVYVAVAQLDGAGAAERAEQRRGIVGHAGSRRR